MMKHYTDKYGVIHAFEGDGSQDHLIKPDMTPCDKPSPTENDLLVFQIVELESQVTQRRIREAVLGIDNGWLEQINAQINELRGQL